MLASSNPGKLREIGALLRTMELVPQSALGIADAEEPHSTFLENALAKARHASGAARLPALADDSGLCVKALKGAPGVHSAHFAGREGERATRDARNNEKLLSVLGEKRDACYVCVMILVRHPDDPRPLVAEGIWRGEIARAPRGAVGSATTRCFGCPRSARRRPSSMPSIKNRISHRAIALQKLLALLNDGT